MEPSDPTPDHRTSGAEEEARRNFLANAGKAAVAAPAAALLLAASSVPNAANAAPGSGSIPHGGGDAALVAFLGAAAAWHKLRGGKGDKD